MGIEIERKWLMNKKPEGLKEITKFISRQWYLSYHDTVVRLTEYMDTTCYQAISPENLFPDKGLSNTTPWIMTIKQTLPVDSNRQEVMRREDEYYLSFIDFQNMTSNIRPAPIIVNVTLYEMPDGKILEYKEVDKGLPTGRDYAEIEFKSIEECEAYELKIPHVEDVTKNPYHKMKNYWGRTRGIK